MTQSRRIAVTGGIGSGKSALCDILKQKGYPVFSCDEISHELWGEEGYRAELAARFPACCREGKIDKRLLSEAVFADANIRRALNDFAHPRIMARLLSRMNECFVAFAEVPLLFEGGYEDLFDGVIALKRSEKKRVAAVCARDGLKEEDVLARMRGQFDAEKLEAKGCFLIENDGDLDRLEAKTLEALAHFGLI